MATRFYEEEVRRGAELLDRRVPGWADRIDLRQLGMLSQRYCVLGQLYGSLNVGRYTMEVSLDELPDHGFNIGLPTKGFGFILRVLSAALLFPILTSEWKIQIEARRRTQQVA